ncbi:MAG: hypothetical protein QOI74_3469, partial [Micromonosporaceae bacterium]|nr:hypothetical protein [Micromonosporaceae bacterium]
MRLSGPMRPNSAAPQCFSLQRMRQALVTGLTLVTAVASVALIAPSAASAGAATGSPGTSTLSTTNIPVGNRHTAPAVTGTGSATQAPCGGRL